MIFIKKSGKDCQVESVNELFGSDKRKLRNELFGSYLSKTFVADTVLSNAESNIKEIGRQLSNLQLLVEELKKQQAEKKANELMRDVDAMSQEQAQALLEKLQAKLAQ